MRLLVQRGLVKVSVLLVVLDRLPVTSFVQQVVDGHVDETPGHPLFSSFFDQTALVLSL